jgi:hypothetical protein
MLFPILMHVASLLRFYGPGVFACTPKQRAQIATAQSQNKGVQNVGRGFRIYFRYLEYFNGGIIRFELVGKM